MNFLTITDLERLRSWGRDLAVAFEEMPYLVGSSLLRADYRDVDVRICVPETTVLPTHPLVFNRAFSEWGRAVTGLQIDFQAQLPAEFHVYDDERRDPIGMAAAAFLRRTEITT